MPRGLKILIAFLIWGVYVDTTHLFLDQYSADITLLDIYGLGNIPYITWAISVTLAIASIILIIKKHQKGINTLYFYFGFQVFVMLLASAIQLIDIDTAREIYADSRELRGLHSKNIETIVSPIGITVMSLLSIAFYSFLAKYVYTTQSYFLVKNRK